jgi:mannose-6-phosphate isomerase-like protein (cupin superfamily)
MSDYTVKSIEELESIHHGAVKLAGAELGIRSFGMQVLDFPAGFSEYPAHDHSADGQEEVYVVLGGGGAIAIDGEEVALEPDMAVRVGPSAKRQLLPGDDGLRVLVLGGVPGQAYEAPSLSEPRPEDGA